MIVTIDRGVDVEARIDDLVGWCASAECRRSWPGVDRVRAHGDALRYDIAVGVPGLPGAAVSVEEQLGPVQTRGGLRRLGSDQLWTWPYGEVASAWAVYGFSPRGATTRLDFRLKYTVPGLAGAEVLNRVRFGRVVEAAVDTYLEGLARQVTVFRTVETSLTLGRPVDEVMAFCLTPGSRLAWPGTETARSEGDVFSYDVDMRVPGIPPARLLVEERVGQPIKEGRVRTVETVHRWTWPGGEVSNCWLTYRFRGNRSSTQLDLTWRFVVPGAIDGQPIDRTRLDTAVGKAPERYLQALSGEPALAGAST